MARAKLHKPTFTDLEVLAMAGAKFPEPEKPGLLDKLLSAAFETAQEKLNEIAVNEILPKEGANDEFDNPPVVSVETVTTEPETVEEEEKKTATNSKKKTTFMPSID